MITHEPEKIQARLEQKAKQRLRKNKPRMKVSGASVKKLQKLIIKKGQKT